MSQNSITELLVEKGKQLFDRPRDFIEFTKVREADELLNDIEGHPHVFVLACVMDRQVVAEKAWKIPYLIAKDFGNFSFATFAKLTMDDIRTRMTHRFTEGMSKNFYQAIRLLEAKYSGKAARIWEGKPSSAEVVYRFLEFHGVGPKIATMAANILARHFKIKFSDYTSVDVSADVHVRRVFARLNLIDKGDKVERTIYRARAIRPDFPGLLDFPVWEIGRNWCHEKNPACEGCYMKDVCPSRVDSK